ncbi:MAG TPA: hypothetical protein VFL64_19945 [Rhizobacter sp.]|nr:hypothetical protein [Rhizobacter sp.]
MKARSLQILWPAFLMAGVMEMLIFVVVDPTELQWFGGAYIEWSRQAIYTVTFVLCWVVTATSSALTALLMAKEGSEDLRPPF